MKENSKIKQKEETRKRIMDVSLNLFSKEGYESVSMAKVAKGAEISKGNLYNYFESKDEMLVQIVLHSVEEIYKDFDTNHDGEISHDELLKFIDDLFRNLVENQPFWKLMFSLMLQPNVLDNIQEHVTPLAESTFGLLYTYFSKMNPEDPVTEMMFFASLLKGAFMQYAFNPSGMDIDKLKEKIISYYQNQNNKTL